MSTPGGMDIKPESAGNGTGLQAMDRKAALAALRQPAREAVDLHELAPVMASFRTYLAEEQERHRRRLRSLGIAFALTLAILVVAPVYMVRQFVESGNAQWRALQENQERLMKPLADALGVLTSQSQQLREELERERAALQAALAAIPPAVVVTNVASAVPAPPVTASPSPPASDVPPITVPPPPQGLGALLQTRGPVEPASPSAAMTVGQTDLQTLLKEVEQAMETRRRAAEAASVQSGAMEAK